MHAAAHTTNSELLNEAYSTMTDPYLTMFQVTLQTVSTWQCEILPKPWTCSAHRHPVIRALDCLPSKQMELTRKTMCVIIRSHEPGPHECIGTKHSLRKTQLSCPCHGRVAMHPQSRTHWCHSPKIKRRLRKFVKTHFYPKQRWHEVVARTHQFINS